MTVPSDPLLGTFADIASQMQSQFDISARLKHRGSKGSAREETLRDFLTDFMPRVVAVTGNAELISTDGQVSNQCDLLVVDASTPPLWSVDSVQVVPIESCHAWIEVKSNLSVAELEKAWQAAVEVKEMPRVAYHPGLMGALFGAADHFGEVAKMRKEMTPQCHVFAYKGASLELLLDTMVKLAADTEPGMGVDSVFILDQGFLNHVNLADVSICAESAEFGIAVSKCDPGQVLLAFNAVLQTRLARVEIYPRLDFNRYVTHVIDGFVGHVRPIRGGSPSSSGVSPCTARSSAPKRREGL